MAGELALQTPDRVEIVESIIQMTAPAAEAITAGQAVRIDANGRFTGSNATAAAENRVYGIAGRTVAAGEAVTAVRKGVFGGYNLAGAAYDAPIYLSDTDGRIATAAGTTTVVVGRVIPAHGQPLGSAAAKLLFVDL